MSFGELGRRLAVAAVGVPAVVLLLFLGGWYITVPLALLAALGAGELYGMAAARGVRACGAGGIAAAAALVRVGGACPAGAAMAPWAFALLSVLLLVSLAAALRLRGPGDAPLAASAVTVAGALYAGLPLAVVPLLHALPAGSGWGGETLSPWVGTFAVALPVAATWVGDAAAYFVGSAWGRRKLAPSISPGKSWIGSWGGLVGAGVAAAVWYLLARPVLPGFPLPLAGVLALGVLLGVAAQVGDLVESLLKREAGVKDSGTLFPGHGGVLDRLDALAFTLPLAYGLLALPGAVS